MTVLFCGIFELQLRISLQGDSLWLDAEPQEECNGSR